MKQRWIVSHPTGRGFIGPQGHGSTTSSGLNWLDMGGPAIPVLPTNPQPGQGPQLPSSPFVPGPTIPGVPVPVPAIPPGSPLINPLQGISDAIKAITGDFLSAGEILIGVALIVFGLLLATGLLERGARTAIRAAPVGRITRAIRR